MKLTIVIPVYISTDLHLDFTRLTIESIKTKHDYQVIVINNFCEPQFQAKLDQLATLPRTQVIDNPKGNILASAWNLGIKLSFEKKRRHSSNLRPQPDMPTQIDPGSEAPLDPGSNRPADFCLLLNNDILLHPLCIDNLVQFAKDHPEFLLWSASEWADARTLAKAKLSSKFSLHPHFSLFMVSPKTIETVGYFDEHFIMGYFEDNDYHTRILVKGFQASAADNAKFYHYGSRTINVDDDLKIEGKFHYQQNRAYFKKKWGLDIHGRAFDPPEAILKEIKPNL